MPIDLTQFHETFYEESFEALALMERQLLRLEAGRRDPELINDIFRAAHSIKGGAATFGFNAIGSFTHSLESLLEGLRAERLALTQPLLQVLLRSVDLLRGMLSARRAQLSINPQQVADLLFEMERAKRPAGSEAKPAPAPALQRYHISFRPLPRLLARHNEPLRLFHELTGLGALQVNADVSRLPPLHELDPESCYLSWSLTLDSTAPRETVLEVFQWSEGDCALDATIIEVPAAPSAVITEVSTPGPLPVPMPLMTPTAAVPIVAAVPVPAVAPPAIAMPHARQALRASAAAAMTVTAAGDALAAPADGTSIRVSVAKVDQLMNSVGELVITQSMLAELGLGVSGVAGERLRFGLEQLERHVRELQEHVMRVRMVPIATVFNRFPRMVRDLSEKLGKLVELQITGSDTELDKGVLEKIGDPLTHLVRNCLDHGIEPSERRRAGGKPARGLIGLHAYHRGSSVRVEISDDGAGLDRARILARAGALGLVPEHEVLSEDAICRLIFAPGFSTTEQATLLSGRGVGLDVVRRNVESLGGRIELQSRQGEGTRFLITLPLTLAIVDGQTVAVGEESYIVPLTAIVESVQLRAASLKQLVGRGEVLAFRGEYVPVARLEQLLGTVRGGERERERERERADGAPSDIVMVVEADGRRMGLIVDELLGQQQVVIKTLETNYGQVEGVAGATILGDGSVALILDVERLTRCAAARRAA